MKYLFEVRIRDAMESQPNDEIKRIIQGAARCCDVIPLGEFEEPEWEVLPP